MAKQYSFFRVTSAFRKKSFWIWMLVLAGCMSTGVAEAQNELFDVVVKLHRQVRMDNGEVRTRLVDGGKAYVFTNDKNAKSLLDGGIPVACKDSFEIDVDGTWKLQVQGDWHIVVKPSEEGLNPVKFKVKKGEKEYEHTYPVPKKGDRELTEIFVNALINDEGTDSSFVPILDEDVLEWEIKTTIPLRYLKKNCRFLFTPKVYEYKKDSSHQFICDIPPALYDSEHYKLAQDRRKRFDYEMNDSLVQYMFSGGQTKKGAAQKYKPIIYMDSKYFVCRYKYRFKMPDVNKYYFYSGPRELEDFTHVYMKGIIRGSHLRKNLWRFLVADFAVQMGELGDSLYEKPKKEFREEAYRYDLLFENNKAILKSNAQNDSIKNLIRNDMQNSKSDLAEVVVSGSASPEGSMERNMELANNRANFAVGLIRSYSQGANVVRGNVEVHTWIEVIERLKEIGRLDIADAIQKRLDAGGRVDRSIIPNWDKDLEPVLSEFRAMNCTYKILTSNPLTPEQAVNAMLYDPNYAEEGSKTFSRGDYFNIYKYAHTYCDDSLKVEKALEELTERVYRKEIAPNRDRAIRMPLYAYIANRHLAYKIVNGTLDTESPSILDGFVNVDTSKAGRTKSRKTGFAPSKGRRDYRINRSDHVCNLALAYFLLKKYKKAQLLAKILPKEPEYNAIANLTLLCSKFVKEPEEAEPGLNYAWNASDLSRAVLAVELRGMLGKFKTKYEMTEDSIKNLLWTLKDDEPRKWYLMALMTIKAPISYGKYSNPYVSELNELKEEETRNQERCEETNDYSWYNSKEAINLRHQIDSLSRLSESLGSFTLKDSVPDYCAYLQRAFDIDSNYYHVYYLYDYDFDQYIRDNREKKLENYVPREYEYIPEYAKHYRDLFSFILKRKKENDALINKDDDTDSEDKVETADSAVTATSSE